VVVDEGTREAPEDRGEKIPQSSSSSTMSVEGREADMVDRINYYRHQQREKAILYAEPGRSDHPKFQHWNPASPRAALAAPAE